MRRLFLLPVLLPLCIFAQVTEDFSDGDFTSNPSWTGDIIHFKLSTSSAVPAAQRPALQLDAPGAGASALAVAQHFGGDLEWKFWVKQSFNSSSGNYARVYLFSDQSDLDAPLYGYFLQTGGADDSIRFYRQDSLAETTLLCLDSVFAGNSTNAMRFYVTRSPDGTWKFFADPSGGQALEPSGEVIDTILPGGEYFGFYCKYTSSNASKFYFDDIYAGPRVIDSIPPSLIKAELVNPSEILLMFSEAVTAESAEYTLNYEINPGIGHPDSAVIRDDPTTVRLYLARGLENGATYTLQVNSVSDPAGNLSGPLSHPVWYYRLLPYDLVFTEIMADPTPPFGLPEYEYLEMHNRSGFSLKIEGLRLKIGGSEHILPSDTIQPGDFLVLCDDDAVENMQHLTRVIGISSFSLPNSGTSLLLSDTSGNTICYIDYDLSWYKNDDKADGGWSLEMIDINNPCKDCENWAGSVDASGGTPGRQNSHAAIGAGGLRILKACCISETEIETEFSESLDSLDASDVSNYLAEPYPGNPVSAIPISPGYRSVRLQFSAPFAAGQVYSLKVKTGAENCIGQELTTELESSFALAEPAGPFDIILNEILFNPAGEGVDYVEIYNRSAKAIDLSELSLASVKNSAEGQPDTQSVVIAAGCTTLLPYRYLVLSSDQETVKSQYFTSAPDAFLDMASFPSYNNDEGRVLLMDKYKTVIDGMDYNEEMHFLMLNSLEGVSLERICQERLGYDSDNWHSAAETAGFGTPGYRNSQYLEVVDDGASFSLQPEVFSPDGDGQDDQLGIVYNFNSPGKLMTVLVFNSEGRLARTLVNNEMPGTEGIYSWDGTLDDRTSAVSGIYIVYVEALGMDGKTSRYRKAAVLTRNR
jgi:hypothetical protein